MKILYLSSLCSIKEYERMFKKYGSTSSHASQKFNRLLVKGLVENGCKVETLTERVILEKGEDDLICPEEVENKIKYVYLRRYVNKKLNRVMTILNAFKYVYKWSKKNPEGIIICDIILGELSIAVWLASKIIKLNTTAIVTDVPSIRAGENRKGIFALPFKIKNKIISTYKSYIFLTEAMNDKLNIQQKPYVIIEGLVDKNIIKERNTLNNKYPEKVVMMAGLLEDIFGVEMLLEAFKKVKNKNARLKFYGRGSSVEKIKIASKEDSRIFYCGELTNRQIVEEEIKATLLINPRPPLGEWTAYSFPSKNMEYMASGTPLVAFNLPCIPKEYMAYFYQFDEYSIESMSKTLQKLLDYDKKIIHKFGLEAQSWIVNNKNSKIQLKKYIFIKNNGV